MTRDDGGRVALIRALMGGGNAPKKDRPGLMDDAARLAEGGRRGDKIIAHINPEEAALLKARGGSGTINPRTGLMEFADMDGQGTTESGAVGPGVSDNPGYGTTDTFGGAAPGAGAMLGEDRAQAPNIGDFAPSFSSSTPGEELADALSRGYSPRGPIEQFSDWAGRQVANKVHDVVNNPFATAIDTLASFTPVGIPNTLSGFVGGPTIGGTMTAAARGVTGYESTPGGLPSDKTDPSGDKDSPLGGDTRGDSGSASGSGGPLSQPQSALAQALMGTTPFNQGRKTFGARVDSFDPNGRRYVTPWAYRG